MEINWRLNMLMDSQMSQVLKTALNRLVTLGGEERRERAEDRPCYMVLFTGEALEGRVEGSRGLMWRPRIQVVGERAFGCTCPDHKKRARERGPCKHVISLAWAGLSDLDLTERLDNFDF